MRHLVFLFFIIIISNQIVAQNIYPFAFMDRYGLVNSKNEIILKPTYYSIDLIPRQFENNYTVFSELKADGSQAKRRFGILDKQGKVIIPAKYEKLEYDGNMKYAFLKISWDTIAILDFINKKIVHQQKFSNYKSKQGLVTIERGDTDTVTLLFHNQKTITWKGFVNIVTHDEKQYYQCSDFNSYTYFDANGTKVNFEPDVYFWDMADAMVEEHRGFNDNDQKTWKATKEKLGEQNLTPITHHSNTSCVISAIYRNPTSGHLQLIDISGKALYDNKDMTALVPFVRDRLPYLQYKVGPYWGLITDYSGTVVLRPEFENLFQILTKNYHSEIWVKHKSGYSGILTSDWSLHLPAESKYEK